MDEDKMLNIWRKTLDRGSQNYYYTLLDQEIPIFLEILRNTKNEDLSCKILYSLCKGHYPDDPDGYRYCPWLDIALEKNICGIIMNRYIEIPMAVTCLISRFKFLGNTDFLLVFEPHWSVFQKILSMNILEIIKFDNDYQFQFLSYLIDLAICLKRNIIINPKIQRDLLNFLMVIFSNFSLEKFTFDFELFYEELYTLVFKFFQQAYSIGKNIHLNENNLSGDNYRIILNEFYLENLGIIIDLQKNS